MKGWIGWNVMKEGTDVVVTREGPDQITEQSAICS